MTLSNIYYSYSLFCLLSEQNFTKLKESEVISAIKSGSKEVLQHFYLEHRDGFMWFIRLKFSVSDADAEDLYQDAVIALVENIRKGKLDNLASSLKTYLFSIGKFMAYKNYKQQLKISLAEGETLPEELEWIDTDEQDANEAIIQLIQSKLNEMGEGCKRILIMFYFEEKKIEDIVKAGNYAGKDVVKSQKSRCLAQLKKLVYGK